MDTKKFTTMAIGLVVAVVLVSGLMVPVIGSVTGSEEDGEVREYRNDVGESNFYFTKLTSDSSYSLTTAYSNSSPQLIINGGEPISLEYVKVLFGEYWVIDLDQSSVRIDGERTYYGSLDVSGMGSQSNGHFTEAQITGNSVHLYNQYTEQSLDLDGALFLQQSAGEYVISLDEDWYATPPYLSRSDFGRYMGYFDNDDVSFKFVIDGDARSNTVYYSVLNSHEMSILPDPARFVIEDDILKEIIITYNGTEHHVVYAAESDESYFDYMIVPTEVRIGGEGSGLSPTLTTLLSVIPLITVVGIIIGAIGFLRMKN